MDKADDVFEVTGDVGMLASFVSVVIFQKIALEIARINGLNPDKPRNLAKTVTV